MDMNGFVRMFLNTAGKKLQYFKTLVIAPLHKPFIVQRHGNDIDFPYVLIAVQKMKRQKFPQEFHARPVLAEFGAEDKFTQYSFVFIEKRKIIPKGGLFPAMPAAGNALTGIGKNFPAVPAKACAQFFQFICAFRA